MAKRNDNVYTNFYGPHLGDKDGTGHGNNQAQNRQALHERMYMRMLVEMVAHRFKWDGMPDSVDVRFLELTLARQGMVVFFQHPDNGRFLVSQATYTGPLNHYDNPTQFRVIANRMNSVTLMGNECVPIWTNYLRIPDWDIISLYATKLANFDIDIEIAADNLRYTKVVTAPEGQRQTWVNIIRQHRQGEPVIFGGPQLDMEAVSAFDVGGAPEALRELLIGKTKVYNECMTALGINNANQDKKERLVTDEVTANDEQVMAMRDVSLTSRQQAADQINAMFDLNVTVDWSYDDYNELPDQSEMDTEIEGGDGENSEYEDEEN